MVEKEALGVAAAIEKALPHFLSHIKHGARKVAGGRNLRDLSIEFDDKFPGGLVDLCRAVADAHANHPAFIERGHTVESLLQFFCCECLRLLSEGSFKYIKVLGNPAARTNDPFRLVVFYENLRIDLTVAAFNRLIGH